MGGTISTVSTFAHRTKRVAKNVPVIAGAAAAGGAVSVAAVDHNANLGSPGPPGAGACQVTAALPDPCHAYYSTTGSYVELAAPGGSNLAPGPGGAGSGGPGVRLPQELRPLEGVV